MSAVQVSGAPAAAGTGFPNASVTTDSDVTAVNKQTTGPKASAFTIHGRNAKAEGLASNSFPYATLMGDWQIVGSSLPLWKNRSDVLCRYTPHSVPSRADQLGKMQAKNGGLTGAEGDSVDPMSEAIEARHEVSFSDEIWWEQLDKNNKHRPGKGAPRDKRSIVRGRNRIDPAGKNDASFLWRGYNFLKPFTSHWQVVAYSNNFFDTEHSEAIWLITYFTETLFTRAGIDLYVRGTLLDGAYEDIVEQLKQHGGDDEASKQLRSLAAEMFPVPVGNI